RERGQADRDVFGAFGVGRGIADPLAFARDDGLTRRYIHDAAMMLHAQTAAQDDGELVELGRLPRLAPARRAAHVRHAGAAGSGVYVADVLVDDLVPGNGDARG